MRMSDQGIKELGKALSKFQEEVRNPANSAVNPQFRSKYAPLDVVINTVKPIMAQNGLSFIQSTGSEGESILVTTLLIHESGEWIESDPLTLPAYQIKGGGVKEFNAQGAGSSLTYARRYSLSAMLGLSSEDDDDANGQVFGGSDSVNKGKNAAPDKAKGTSATTKEPSARDKAIAEAKANSEAKKAEEAGGVQSDTSEETAPEGTNNGVEPINKGQLVAIGNMLKLIAKKKGKDFDIDSYTSELVASRGKSTLEELSFVDGREIVLQLNSTMRT